MSKRRPPAAPHVATALHGLLVDVATLELDPANLRTHPEASVAAVAASLERHGQQKPVVYRPADRVVIAGNGTLLAARRLGWTTIAAVPFAGSAREARAYALADNATYDRGGWNAPALRVELGDLVTDFAPLALGFDEASLSLTLAEPPAPPAPHDDRPGDDDVPPPPAEPVTQPGEVVPLGRHALTCGDCVEVMRTIADGSIDAIVTDPPYGIGFMGKAWDALPPGPEFAAEALRVLKPGGHVVAFGGTRTVHRLAVALEDAGFEIRDTISWLYYNGFPKSLDVAKAMDAVEGHLRGQAGPVVSNNGSMGGPNYTRTPKGDPVTDDAKQWDGWGTGLKPAQEPAILARKPLIGTVVETVLAHGTGALNIDGCRIAYGDASWPGPQDDDAPPPAMVASPIGRFPANVYACPKPARSERDAGCDGLAPAVAQGADALRDGGRTESARTNTHATVKPVRLMRWLVRLVTPPGGVVLEPFAGSGTTLVACEREGFACIGIEREPAYCDIIRARVAHAVEG